MSCLHRHLLRVVDNACKENAQNAAMHRRTPLAQQPGIQKSLLQDKAGNPPTGQLGIDKLLLPSGSARVPEGC